MCVFGKDRKSFPLDAISSQLITEGEFNQWVEVHEKHRIKLPSHASAKNFRIRNVRVHMSPYVNGNL